MKNHIPDLQESKAAIDAAVAAGDLTAAVDALRVHQEHVEQMCDEAERVSQQAARVLTDGKRT